MKLCIFEDDGYANLYPLTYLRPVFELRCGTKSLAERVIERVSAEAVCYFVRDWMTASFRTRADGAVNDLSALDGDDILIVNGRLLALGIELPKGGDEVCACAGEDVVYAFVKKESWNSLKGSDFAASLDAIREKLPSAEIDAKMIKYPWDLIEHNGEAIEEDFSLLGKSGIEGTMSDKAAIWGDESRVYVAKGAEIHPFVTLDSKGGPVIIDEGAEIHPNSRIEGPGYIGKDTIIFGGKIREGCSIGPVCRVGGEVEETIFHGYSNKYHDGFIGHAYICPWVNLGALTTNSDLKNDYKSVEVFIGGDLIDSGSTKVGCFIGDHTKTSIGTLFNTGSVVGVMCNLLGGSGIMPKFIPSFSMVMNGKFYKTGFKTQCATARTAMGRRKKELLPEDEALLKHVYDMTSEERMELVRQSRRELAKEAGL